MPRCFFRISIPKCMQMVKVGKLYTFISFMNRFIKYASFQSYMTGIKKTGIILLVKLENYICLSETFIWKCKSLQMSLKMFFSGRTRTYQLGDLLINFHCTYIYVKWNKILNLNFHVSVYARHSKTFNLDGYGWPPCSGKFIFLWHSSFD